MGKQETRQLGRGDYKCCDACLESFPSHDLSETPDEPPLHLCTVCLHDYELST